jgi:predicted DNA-binding transcriptional regulator YafY
MAPRKRTPTEKTEAPVDIVPKAEPKSKATKAAAKKPAPAAKKKAVPEAPAAVAEVVAKPRTSSKKASPKLAPTPAPAPVVKTETQRPTFTPHAQTVMEAMADGRAIELIFTDGDANPPRTFEARQLIFDVFTGSWFTWGWDRRYNAERHHRLDQLAEINPVEGPGRSAQGPFPEGTPANQIGGWRGGEPILVKALLQKQWIFAVKQAPAPFPDFRIEDLEDGKAQVSFSGTDLRAIARWCMQFGDGIQVQEPLRLVDRIKQVGSTWAGKPAVQAAAAPQPKAHPKPEARPEPKPEPRPEPRRQEPPRKEAREPREFRETEAPKAKPGRVEIRIERL